MGIASRRVMRPTRLAPGATCSSVFDPRRNSLGFLRYLFAALVVVDHSYPIGGFGRDPMWRWSGGQDSFGGLAVAGFFVISGFLVTRSWFSSRSTLRYLWRRFLRIFPGFWACLLVTSFVFAPIAWWREYGQLGGFLSAPSGPIDYLRLNGLLWMGQYDIAGLLRTTPYRTSGYPMAFDGSLWTLIYEFRFYLLLAVVGMAGVLRRARGLVLGTAVFLYGVTIWQAANPAGIYPVFPLLRDPFVARFGLLFSLGALFELYGDRIPMLDGLGILAASALVWSLNNGGYLALGYPALAYLVLWLAIRLPFQRFDRHGDFSYGLYIYAFPIQQMLALFGVYRLGVIPFMAASLLGGTAAAIASWKLIEAPALGLKNWSFRPPGSRRTGFSERAPTPTSAVAATRLSGP